MFVLFRRRKPREPMPTSAHMRRDIGVPLLLSPQAAFLLTLGAGNQR